MTKLLFKPFDKENYIIKKDDAKKLIEVLKGLTEISGGKVK